MIQDSEPTPLQIIERGLAPYREVWEQQQILQRELIAGNQRDTLIVCSHPPVITVGRGGNTNNILSSPEYLKELGVEIVEIERGGDVTYHGPDQIILYPIINLSLKKRDVGWYMRMLEEVVILSLIQFDLKAVRIPGKTGVWMDSSPPRKISSLGVRLSRWCSMHGIAINATRSRLEAEGSPSGFSLIHPCGMPTAVMTSIEEEISLINSSPSHNEQSTTHKNKTPFDKKELQKLIVELFCQVFRYHPIS